MKNKINSYFLLEYLKLFSIILFTLASVVWVVQSVNYLDLVVEDGHAFKIYFAYAFLSIPKSLTKLIPFTFFITLILTIIKFERDNELIVFWTSGLNKMNLVNNIFFISILFTLLQWLMATTIAPQSLNYSRSLLKNSQLTFYESLIKEKKFNDTIKGFTIFIEKEDSNGNFQNVFIKDDTKVKFKKVFDEYGNIDLEKSEKIRPNSSTIFAKSGYFANISNTPYLVLMNGTIQKEKEDGNISSLNFDKTQINLDQYATKTITYPKVQESNTIFLIKNCYLNLISIKTNYNKTQLKGCPYKGKDAINELNKRIGMPLYIPLLSLICCYLLSSRREEKNDNLQKWFYFFIGFIVLIFAEIVVRYSGKAYYLTLTYYLVPLSLAFINYLLLVRKFKFENLKV